MQNVRRLRVRESAEGRPLYSFAEGFVVMSLGVHQAVIAGELKGLPLRLWFLMQQRSHKAGRGMSMVQRVSDTQVAMAEALGVRQPHISAALRELQRLGYVYRAKGDDGRSYVWLDARRVYAGSAKSHAHTLERQVVQRRKSAKVAKVIELRSAIAEVES